MFLCFGECSSKMRWVWTKILHDLSPSPPFGNVASSTNSIHQKLIWIANNWFHKVCCGGVLDVFEGFNLQHFWGDAVWEFLHLLPDIFQEDCARTPSNEHDRENGDAYQVNCHCCAPSDWMKTYLRSKDTKLHLACHFYFITDKVWDHVKGNTNDFFSLLH